MERWDRSRIHLEFAQNTFDNKCDLNIKTEMSNMLYHRYVLCILCMPIHKQYKRVGEEAAVENVAEDALK